MEMIFLALFMVISANAGMQSAGTVVQQSDTSKIGGVVISTGVGVSEGGTQRVVLAADIVISSGVVTAAGQTVVLTANGHSSGAVQISGTWTGQFEFEATVNGIDWLSRDMRGPIVLTNVTATNNIFTFPIGPFASFRVRASVFTSGSATVFFRASTGNYYPQ